MFKIKKYILVLFLSAIVSNAQFLGDTTNEIVFDTYTNLTWEDGNNTTINTYNWIDAVDYCKNLDFANSTNWRVPNINELETIIDDKRANPAVQFPFINTANNIYWSSTTYESSTDSAWSIDFSTGGSTYSNKTSTRYVRCVH